MHINACDATTGWKGFSLSITQLHNVSYHILPFLLSYCHEFEAQCSVSAQ